MIDLPYSWVRGTVLADVLNHRRIVGAVDAQLSLKGLVKAERSASPDVRVAYHATFEPDLEINGFPSGRGRRAGCDRGAFRPAALRSRPGCSQGVNPVERSQAGWHYRSHAGF